MKYFLKQTTYLLLEAKTPSYFITCVKTRNSIVSNYHRQLQQNVKKNVNAFFIVEVHLAIKLVYRYSTVNKVKVTIGKLNRNILRTPTGGRQPVGYLQSMVELNPGQPETNPNQRL